MKPALLTLCLLMSAALAQTPPAPKPVTIPITLDHNRIIIDVRFPLPDGTTKRVRGLVDNGTPEMRITGDLAEKLGLPVTNKASREQNAPAPAVLLVGGMELKASGTVRVDLHADSILPGSSAEINLPSTLLRNYDVFVDYFNRELTLGLPGTVPFKGTPAKAFVNRENGLIQLPATIAKEDVNLGLDLGSSFSTLLPDPLAKLRSLPWPRMTGAVGSANLWGGPDEAQRELVRIPSLQFGGIQFADVGMEAFPQEFVERFEALQGRPTAGVIGANALLNYRVGIDYAHATVYFDQTSKHRPPDMDVVGLVLRPESDGRYTIIGVADYQGKLSVPEVKPGDALVAIDKVPAKGGTMGQVWSLLGGSPGDTRVLTIERDGKQITVPATVRRFLDAAEEPEHSNK